VWAPDKVRVLFPAPFEDGGRGLSRRFFPGRDGALPPVHLTWTGAKHPCLLHAAIKVRLGDVARGMRDIDDADLSGQSVLALADLEGVRGGSAPVQTVRLRLWSGGLPLADVHGRPVSLRADVAVASALLAGTDAEGEGGAMRLVTRDWAPAGGEGEDGVEEEEDGAAAGEEDGAAAGEEDGAAAGEEDLLVWP
jgi:hypothetical protein